MKTYYTHTELVEMYRAGLITLDEFFSETGYTSMIAPVR